MQASAIAAQILHNYYIAKKPSAISHQPRPLVGQAFGPAMTPSGVISQGDSPATSPKAKG